MGLIRLALSWPTKGGVEFSGNVFHLAHSALRLHMLQGLFSLVSDIRHALRRQQGRLCLFCAGAQPCRRCDDSGGKVNQDVKHG